MELPHLGEHCSEKTCKRLDFLPMKCDACDNIFCKDHITYANHKCTSSYMKDIQVPVCPLCNIPIPIKRGEMPDIKVGEHIDRDCKSDPAQRKRKLSHMSREQQATVAFRKATLRYPGPREAPPTLPLAPPQAPPPLARGPPPTLSRPPQPGASTAGHRGECPRRCPPRQHRISFQRQHPSRPACPQEQEDLALAQALAASEEEFRRQQQQRQQVPRKLSHHGRRRHR
ncbi:hypothetical protein CRUP_022003 [Coryphaenoides rupestris]|nr:hypothetical protein CRUP_022003 [Coryphaenoides rupestris]